MSFVVGKRCKECSGPVTKEVVGYNCPSCGWLSNNQVFDK